MDREVKTALRLMSKRLTVAKPEFTQYEYFDTLKGQYERDELTIEQKEAMGIENRILLTNRRQITKGEIIV